MAKKRTFQRLPYEKPITQLNSCKHIYQKEIKIPVWLPQYEHLENASYNRNKNHELMEYLDDEANKYKTWQELPEKIKKDFGNNPNYYKGYLKYKNALL